MNSIAAPGRHRINRSDELVVRIDYVNYRGERAVRRIVPERAYLGEVEWHAGRQWIIDAWDVDKRAIRSFAVTDIQGWCV
jgi:predicted DNA-binding transcriptional regulator YafY